MFERGEAVLDGCFIQPWAPDWECADCRHRWFDPEDPAKQEMEELLRSILERHARPKTP